MNIKRTTRMSVFLFAFSLMAADACLAAWPAKEANRCWAAFWDYDGTQAEGYALRMHIVPIGLKTSVVTGEAAWPVSSFPLTGTAVINGANVDWMLSFPWWAFGGEYENQPFTVSRYTLEFDGFLVGNAHWKPVPCR